MIRGTTRLAAVIGWPVDHSRSPQMLNAAFAAAGIDAAMVPIGAPPDGLPTIVTALRTMRALGASVTIPHKLAVAALCDEVTEAARAIGAVNCLHVDGARLVGHNTDRDGFLDALAAAGCAHRGHAVLLGAGGAARAVAHGLATLGSVEVIARDPTAIGWTTASSWTPDVVATAFARAALVVDCTPVALAGGDPERAFVDALPLDRLHPDAWLGTLVYHRQALLLERGAARGHRVVDGRGMLVHQGARAFTIWTGAPASVEAMAAALDASLHGT